MQTTSPEDKLLLVFHISSPTRQAFLTYSYTSRLIVSPINGRYGPFKPCHVTSLQSYCYTLFDYLATFMDVESA